MSDDKAALADRAVIAVTGPDARAFLQRLVTNDVETLGAGEARYAALLTPQGKIVTDFLAVGGMGGGVLLDAPAATAADLVKRLSTYRLRAKVDIADQTGTMGVVAFSGDAPIDGLVVAYADPRAPTLWSRAIVARGAMPAPDAEAETAFRRNRIEAGVPDGGVDFAYGDTFPHDANLDHLAGVDFTKGCYVGQEVVSRVQHRGTARKRIVPAAFQGEPPPPGAEILAGDVAVGVMGTSVAGRGLATVRLDRIAELGVPVTAAGVVLHLTRPAWA